MLIILCSFVFSIAENCPFANGETAEESPERERTLDVQVKQVNQAKTGSTAGRQSPRALSGTALHKYLM